MNPMRRELLTRGLSELPTLAEFKLDGRNGEAIATDEAAVWKRVLLFRVANWLQPSSILETHPGLGVGTALYRRAAPAAKILSLNSSVDRDIKVDLIDVDPFGQPWETLRDTAHLFSTCRCIMVTNGEAHAVIRNFKNAQRYPTANYGKRMPFWILEEYLPRLQDLTGMRLQFFYAFPTSVRMILGRTSFPDDLWVGCPRWMWWLSKYGPIESDRTGKVS